MLSTESLQTRCPPSRLRFRTVLLCIAIQRYKLVKKFESWLQGVDLKGPQAREDGFRELVAGFQFPMCFMLFEGICSLPLCRQVWVCHFPLTGKAFNFIQPLVWKGF